MSARVVVISAGVGAGHDGAAYELARRLRERGAQVAMHDYLDALPVLGRRLLRDGYQPTVQRAPRLFAWLFRNLEHRGPVQAVAQWLCRRAAPRVRRWSEHADVVVSTYPFASQTLGRLRAAGVLAVPAVTFLTDPAAHRTWIHPGIDHHLTVTAATGVDGAARYGVELRPVGALVGPGFSRPVPGRDRRRVRRELGVGAATPVVLIAAGSLGLGEVPAVVEAALGHRDVVVLVLCGRNEDLRASLAARERVVALGWRPDVPELLAAADVLVHNAGGLSFTEALVAGLPAVTYLPIPGHGRANAAVLAAAGLAPWPRDPAALVRALDEVLARPRPGPTPPGIGDASAVVAGLAGLESPSGYGFSPRPVG